MENPVYYVQYAHARIAVDRAQGGRARASPDCRSLDTSTSRRSTHERELDLLRALAAYPGVLAEAAAAAGAAPGHHLGARLRQGVPRVLPRLPGHLRRRRADPGAPVAGRGLPARPGRTRSRILGVARARPRWRASTTPSRAQRMSPRRLRPRAAAPLGRGRRRRALRRSAASTSRRWPTTFGTPLYVYDEAELRTRCRDYRGRLRADAASPTRARRSCAVRWSASSTRRACTSTSPPAASSTSRCTAGFPAARSSSTATTSPTPSCGPGARRRRRAHRRRLRSTSSTASSASSPPGCPGPRVLVRVTPGRRGAHPRVHRDRHRRLEVRVHRVERRGPGRRGARSRKSVRWSWWASTATSGRRSSGSTRSRSRRPVVADLAAEVERATGAAGRTR